MIFSNLDVECWITLSKIGLGDLITDESAGVEDGRVGIELHRLDHILLDDADLERQRRHLRWSGFSLLPPLYHHSEPCVPTNKQMLINHQSPITHHPSSIIQSRRHHSLGFNDNIFRNELAPIQSSIIIIRVTIIIYYHCRWTIQLESNWRSSTQSFRTIEHRSSSANNRRISKNWIKDKGKKERKKERKNKIARKR